MPAQEIVSTRPFPVPCPRRFAAWTDSVASVRWRGPKGLRNAFRESEPRPVCVPGNEQDFDRPEACLTVRPLVWAPGKIAA